MLAECFLSQLAVESDTNPAFVHWCLRGQGHRLVAPFIGGGALQFFQTRAILLARRLGMSRQDFRLGSVMRAPIANVRQAWILAWVPAFARTSLWQQHDGTGGFPRLQIAVRLDGILQGIRMVDVDLDDSFGDQE